MDQPDALPVIGLRQSLPHDSLDCQQPRTKLRLAKLFACVCVKKQKPQVWHDRCRTCRLLLVTGVTASPWRMRHYLVHELQPGNNPASGHCFGGGISGSGGHRFRLGLARMQQGAGAF
jgi:hypothetical protein